MSNRQKKHQAHGSPIATNSGPKPGDFPLGSAKSRAAARAAVDRFAAEQRQIEQAEYGNLTPLEIVMSEGYSGYQKQIAVGVAQMMEEKARIFQFSWPPLEEIRYKFALAREIDRLADGQGRFLQNNDPEEYGRLKAIAEKNLAQQR